jgi:hypothetical protein
MVWADDDMSELPEFPNMRRRPENLTFRWLAGILVSLLVLAATGWAAQVNGRLDRLETMNNDRGERLARIEAQLVTVTSQLSEIRILLNGRPR